MTVGPVAAGADLEPLKAKAEKSEEWAATEFKWERDEHTGWTERLQLRYISKATGRWNKSAYYIDKVPVLDSAEARSAGS
jgi:hypothetical protein